MSGSLVIRVDLAPAAERDLEAIVDFLFARSPGLAERFADDYERTVLLIGQFPRAGREAGGFRRIGVGRSGYQVFYIERGSLVRIVRIEHSTTLRPFA